MASVKVESFSERLKKALLIRDMRQVDLIEKTGINKGAMSSYMSGRYEPKQIALNKIAIALDVSEIWLLGYAVPMDRPAEEKRNDNMVRIVNLMNTNDSFFNVVIALSGAAADRRDLVAKILAMPDDQFQSIVQLLNVFTKE